MRQSGQAAVESALILPLYVFVLLGTLQLMLMHQARLMTKYAAYKATRAGSLHNAQVSEMEIAALAVLLPMISEKSGGGAEYIQHTQGAAAFLQKWNKPNIMTNRMLDTGLQYVEITICGPLKRDVQPLANNNEVDFDDPAVAASSTDWAKSEATKLRVQVTFNYRMPIPFANWVIHRTAMNETLPWVVALNSKNQGTDPRYPPPSSRMKYLAAAQATGVYVLPIRANYTMRMQSNIYVDKAPIPDNNDCIFPWN